MGGLNRSMFFFQRTLHTIHPVSRRSDGSSVFNRIHNHMQISRRHVFVLPRCFVQFFQYGPDVMHQLISVNSITVHTACAVCKGPASISRRTWIFCFPSGWPAMGFDVCQRTISRNACTSVFNIVLRTFVKYGCQYRLTFSLKYKINPFRDHSHYTFHILPNPCHPLDD